MLLGRASASKDIELFITPATVLRWHGRLAFVGLGRTLEVAGVAVGVSDRTSGCAHQVLRALGHVAAARSDARIVAVAVADSQTNRHW